MTIPNQPTPETDAFSRLIGKALANDRRDIVTQAGKIQDLINEHVAKLEHERDEARNITSFALDKDYYTKYQNLCAELEVTKTERDQLH